MKGKRPKKKLKGLPTRTWLPQALDDLGLERKKLLQLNLEGEFWEDVGPGRRKRILCTRVAQRLNRALVGAKPSHLQKLYNTVCRSRIGYTNKTFMVRHLGYKISEGLGLMTKRMKANYAELQRQSPEEKIDVYGSSWRTEYQKKYKKYKEERDVALGWDKRADLDLQPGRVRTKKGWRNAPAKARKEKTPRGPTLVSIIVECLTTAGKKGATKKEILAAAKEKAFKKFDAVRTMKTIGVQLGHHLPKKYKILKKNDKFILSGELHG